MIASTALGERDPRRALEKARARIADPQDFTRSHSARSKTGAPCSPLQRSAVRWDASGALMWATGRRSDCPGNALLVEAAGGFRAFVELSTRGTHAEILALYDRAIAMASRRPDDDAPGATGSAS
jgi:hypothetical protein